ncbi:MAG: aconitate hydratase [Peptococcaceae bacterium]|jgi:aconitate hydratase|nr:aconitate hydratase [Peptococcaceae bacterium]MDH7524807.1 aconitate hydratase [Peptococcaceae bacterium]
MGLNLTQKIIKAHLVEGEMKAGREIAIKIDQTLTQDATGTMAYLQFEAIGIPRVKTELSVSYVDHNTLQAGFENADDHKFLQTVAAKYGIHYSRAGNGICHQVHLERFGKPGKTLLGSDSHTPTGGGLGMLAIGAGGLDVALAMAGQPFYLTMPEVINVRLTGRLAPWVSAKDIILELLRRLTVKGGVGKVFEYGGPGVAELTVPERATITNMGAELGATTSIFPSDAQTQKFLKVQQRAADFVELLPDPDAAYDGTIEIDLSLLEPLAAKPHSPDNVAAVRELEGQKIDQVFIGSCTNSSYADLVRVARILKGKTVHPDVSLCIAPGSRQVFYMLAKEGVLASLIASGARILESACGPCIGVGQAPASGAVSLRTSNRNFEGRSGTADARVYLAGAETCAVAALTGCLTDPRKMGDPPGKTMPEEFTVDDSMIIEPPRNGSAVEVVRGPNIKPLPDFDPLPGKISAAVVLKVGDNITTDHIMPAGAQILSLRSNIPAISRYVFSRVDPAFYQRVVEEKGGIIVGGHNYGQGSSREHAALAPRYLGIKAVLARSFARIHLQNLINFGILPLTFADEGDYEAVNQGDRLELDNLLEAVRRNEITARNLTRGASFRLKHSLTPRQVEIVTAGGLLKYAGLNLKK